MCSRVDLSLDNNYLKSVNCLSGPVTLACLGLYIIDYEDTYKTEEYVSL